VQRADSRKFELLSLDGRRMQVPKREVIAPHRAALEWHAGRFARVSGGLVHLIRFSRVSGLRRFSRVPASAGGSGSLSRRSRAGGRLDEVTRDGKASSCAVLITGRWMPGCSRLPRTPTAIVVSPLVPRPDSRKFEMHGSRLDGRRRQVPRREVIAPQRACFGGRHKTRRPDRH